MTRRILLVAGEASGDAHAAAVLEALHARCPTLEAFGVGGRACRKAGLDVLVPAENMALAGLTEVLAALPRMARYMRQLTQACKIRRPQVAVLVDLPDFNLRLAKRLKAQGIYVIYYVSPQVWAWRAGRVATIRAVVDEMLVILPFEEAFYRARGVAAQFVGHPLVEALDAEGGVPTQAAARAQLGLGDAGGEVLALLPGSRRKEVVRHLPAMLAGAATMRQLRPNLRILLPLASTVDAAYVARLVAASRLDVTLVDGHSTQVLAACDAAVVCSGTATLQTALVGRPMVVVYRVSALTFFVLRRLVRVAHVGLVNLIAGQRLVPELLQKAVSGENIAHELAALMAKGPRRDHVLGRMQGLRALLSERRPAEQVAQAVLAYPQTSLAQDSSL